MVAMIAKQLTVSAIEHFVAFCPCCTY